ncbi:MAG: heparinase II/III family protein [Ruminococcus sp.]|nr:heparinase II/III family protein [Candidatus Apopatosoma intestinale]
MFTDWTPERLHEITYRPPVTPTWHDRNYWTSLPKPMTGEIVKNAEKYIDFEFLPIRATDFLAFRRTGNRTEMERRHLPRREALAQMTLAECIENKGRFVDPIINVLWMLCEETYWGSTAHFDQDIRQKERELPCFDDPYLDLHASNTGSIIAWTLYLLEDKIGSEAPSLVERVKGELDRRILSVFERHYEYWWMGYYRKINNWCPYIAANVLNVVLLCEKDKARQDRIVHKCLKLFSNFTRDYPADGGCDEGTSYWAMAGGTLFEGLEFLYDTTGGKIDYFSHPLIRNIAEYMVKMHATGEYFLNFGDGGPKAAGSCLVLFRYGEKVGSRQVTALGAFLYQRLRRERLLISGLNRPGSLLMELNCAVRAMQTKTLVAAPYDSVLPDLQIAALRECDDENLGLYVAVKGGNNGESHNHNDVGSLICYIDGAPAIVDAGVETYRRQTFGEERYSLWTMQSAWHNLPTVNGQMQKNGKEYRATSFASSANLISTVDVAFASAYPEEAHLASLSRSVELNRDARRITVSDSYAFTQGANTVSEHLLLCASPNVRPGLAVCQTFAGITFGIAFDPSYTVTVEEQPLSDPKIAKDWNGLAALYRLTLTATLPQSGKMEYSIQR